MNSRQQLSEPLPYLAYTLAIDPPGSGGHRNMAKLLVSSLLRTGFAGERT